MDEDTPLKSTPEAQAATTKGLPRTFPEPAQNLPRTFPEAQPATTKGGPQTGDLSHARLRGGATPPATPLVPPVPEPGSASYAASGTELVQQPASLP